MAIKTIGLRCPHCRKKISSFPTNDYCVIKDKWYGNPNQVCRKCKKTYRQFWVEEAASALTLKEQVPFWLTSTRTLVLFILLAVIALVCTYGFGLLFIIPVYLLTCLFSRKYRQTHKNKVLAGSRNRLKDKGYFLRYLVSKITAQERSMLTNKTFTMVYAKAIKVMDEDRPLEVEKIVNEVLEPVRGEKKNIMGKLTAGKVEINIFGEAIIPQGTTEIAWKAFDGNKSLRSISVPGTVKRIGERAFANCINLKAVHLAEGIETIESNVFTGCLNLEELTLPDSIREQNGWAFYDFTGLKNPVYNRSKTTLYCYPCTVREKIFKVPDGVTLINNAAFNNNPYLEEVVLPETLEVLKSRTFLDCGIQRITIPKTVKKIETMAFYGCRFLKEISVLGVDTEIEMGAFLRMPSNLQIYLPKQLRIDERLHLQGITFLQQVRTEVPEDCCWKSEEFLKMAQNCALGDAEAMWSFGNYLLSLGSHPFYEYAANFWRYRACQKGDPDAKNWFFNWVEEHPEKAMPSLMNEMLFGNFDGKILKGMGFLFFDSDREYSISRADRDGIVEVSSWSSTEGPDSDGFGMEECYDWWYLDENLNKLPDVGYIHDYSHLDKENNREKFQALHDAAKKAIRNRCV